MNIKTQIEKMKEEWLKYYATIAGAPAPLRLNAIPQFWLANFSSLIDEEVKLLEGKKNEYYENHGCAGISKDGWCCPLHKGFTEGIDCSITTLQELKKLL